MRSVLARAASHRGRSEQALGRAGEARQRASALRKQGSGEHAAAQQEQDASAIRKARNLRRKKKLPQMHEALAEKLKLLAESQAEVDEIIALLEFEERAAKSLRMADSIDDLLKRLIVFQEMVYERSGRVDRELRRLQGVAQRARSVDRAMRRLGTRLDERFSEYDKEIEHRRKAVGVIQAAVDLLKTRIKQVETT